jgi:integrase
MENYVMSGIGRQAKNPSEYQIQASLAWLETRKHAGRNRLIVLLSYKAGLRAKEIASLKWSMVMSADGNIGDHIHLTNEASKGESGRVIALNKDLRKQLIQVKEKEGITIARSPSPAGRQVSVVTGPGRWLSVRCCRLMRWQRVQHRTFAAHAERQHQVDLSRPNRVSVQVGAGIKQ